MGPHASPAAVLLLSGGLDSAANLALRDQFEVGLCLTVDYGQRGAVRELDRAGRLARHFGVEHVAFDLRSFRELVGPRGALLGGGDVPVPSSLEDPTVTKKTAAAVWVPNRNGVLISLAAAVAESRGLGAVAVGFNAEEAVTFPDNGEPFMAAMTRALGFSTANGIRVLSATAGMTKTRIVGELAKRDFPFEHLWSCYHAGPTHCGACESCQRLHRALNSGLPAKVAPDVVRSLFR